MSIASITATVKTVVTGIALAVLPFAVPVWAETVEAPPEAAADEVEVTGEQLEKAVSAYVMIAEVYQKLQEELADVDDQEAIEQRLGEAEKEIAEGLREIGLDEEEYGRIMGALEDDQALLAAFVGKLHERQPPEQRQMQPPPIDPATITDQQLDQAADIFNAVQRIGQQVQQDLEGVEDQAEIQSRVAEAETEMMKEVERIGMDPQRYENIMRTLQHDQELLEKFLEKIDQ